MTTKDTELTLTVDLTPALDATTDYLIDRLGGDPPAPRAILLAATQHRIELYIEEMIQDWSWYLHQEHGLARDLEEDVRSRLHRQRPPTLVYIPKY